MLCHKYWKTMLTAIGIPYSNSVSHNAHSKDFDRKCYVFASQMEHLQQKAMYLSKLISQKSNNL